MILYSVYDEVARVYNAPFTCPNDDVAKRDFGTASMDENTALNRYPNDYVLYRVGELDNHTGELSYETPVRLCKAADFVRREVSSDDV